MTVKVLIADDQPLCGRSSRWRPTTPRSELPKPVSMPGATAALNFAGIPGRVVILGGDPGCTTTSADIDPTDLYPDGTNTRAFGNRGPSTATFSTSDYPAGGGLLLVLIDHPLSPRPGRPSVEPPSPPVVFVVAFDNAAKIPTCINPDIEPGTGG